MATMNVLSLMLLLMVGWSWQREDQLIGGSKCYVQVSKLHDGHILCGSNGTCNPATGCKCDEGFTGLACEKQLTSKLPNIKKTYEMAKCYVQVMADGTESICGKHGRCCNKMCVCDAGYEGYACEYRAKKNISIVVKTYREMECETQVLKDDKYRLCGEYGVCVPNQGCRCDRFYSGEACERKNNSNIPGFVSVFRKHKCFAQKIEIKDAVTMKKKRTHILCGEHGYCNPRSGCECHEGYMGPACEYELSQKVPEVKETYRRRKCYVQVLKDGTHSICGGQDNPCTEQWGCVCNEGHLGNACEYTSAKAMPDVVHSTFPYVCPLQYNSYAKNNRQCGWYKCLANGTCDCGQFFNQRKPIGYTVHTGKACEIRIDDLRK